jgi:hypothetical protein
MRCVARPRAFSAWSRLWTKSKNIDCGYSLYRRRTKSNVTHSPPLSHGQCLSSSFSLSQLHSLLFTILNMCISTVFYLQRLLHFSFGFILNIFLSICVLVNCNYIHHKSNFISFIKFLFT